MSVTENIAHIQKKISASCGEWHRAREDVRLLAVSKKQPIEKLHDALNAGHRLFAENKVQEAQEHWSDIKPDYPDIQLHLIGPLQTNKIKDAIELFDMIHTVDREKLARKLSQALQEQNKTIPCLIQVNIGEESQKSGVTPLELPDFLAFCTKECGLDIRGLMCIPPVDEPAALYFALLRKIAEGHKLKELSMGMSADYEKAVALGATYIRIGTGIFGERP